MNPNRANAGLDTVTVRDILHRAAQYGAVALALAVFAALMWFAWFGWDNEYYQVRGQTQGPYRAWQIIGCGICIAIASVVAYLRVRGVLAIFVLAFAADVGFAIPWTVHAATSAEDASLYLVGLQLLLASVAVGLSALLAATWLVLALAKALNYSRVRP